MVLNLRARSEEQTARYKNPDNHPKGPWVAGDLSANVKGGRYVASLNYPIVNPNTGEAHYPPNNGNWRYSQETMNRLLANNEIFFGEDGRGRPKLKRFLCNVKEGITYTSLWDFVPFNTQGSKEMIDIMGGISIFDNPKPMGLILELLRMGSSNDSIILDFFSGSATTAHAVMQLNAEDGGQRKYIMVQLPEKTDESSEAYKAGYPNICEIGKERIRRAGRKIREELIMRNSQCVMDTNNSELRIPHSELSDLDIGFRVLRLDSSNMQDVYYNPAAMTQDLLSITTDNIKPDRTPEDLLFQVMLDLGVELSSPIVIRNVECGMRNKDDAPQNAIPNSEFRIPHSTYTYYDVADGFLIACFDKGITGEVVTEIAKRQPYYAVFRDSSMADDSTATNFDQIFETYSHNTVRKVL